MSTNKAAVQAKINEIETGVLNPASTVRDVLKDSSDSVLESVYSDSLTDDEATEAYTTANSNFEYDVTLSKVGGDAMITGRFKALASVNTSGTILEISDTDFTCISSRYNSVANKTASFDNLPIYIIGNTIKIGASILIDEQYYFTIKYKTLN